jgi:hypothetical protein
VAEATLSHPLGSATACVLFFFFLTGSLLVFLLLYKWQFSHAPYFKQNEKQVLFVSFQFQGKLASFLSFPRDAN